MDLIGSTRLIYCNVLNINLLNIFLIFFQNSFVVSFKPLYICTRLADKAGLVLRNEGAFLVLFFPFLKKKFIYIL